MGDLGNIIVNKNGKVKYSLIANNLRLTGKYSVIGSVLYTKMKMI